MVTKINFTLGFLFITLLATGVIYISMNDVRMRIDEDKAVFYINESRWLISALQEDRLFSGTSIVDRVKATIVRKNYTEDNLRVEYRFTGYENGESIIHTWKFDPYTEDVEDFPIEEKICVANAKGKYYRYSLKQLYEPGPKRKLIDETSASFGRNMEVTFEPDYSWAWIGWPYGGDSFAVQYKIDSDYKCLDIRLFDPIIKRSEFDLYKVCDYEFFNKTTDMPDWQLDEYNSTCWHGIKVNYSCDYSDTLADNYSVVTYDKTVDNPYHVIESVESTCYNDITKVNSSCLKDISVLKHNYSIIVVNKTVNNPYYVCSKSVRGPDFSCVKFSNLTVYYDIFWNESVNCKQYLNVDGEIIDTEKADMNCIKIEEGDVTCDSVIGGDGDGVISAGESGIIFDKEDGSISYEGESYYKDKFVSVVENTVEVAQIEK